MRRIDTTSLARPLSPKELADRQDRAQRAALRALALVVRDLEPLGHRRTMSSLAVPELVGRDGYIAGEPLPQS